MRIPGLGWLDDIDDYDLNKDVKGLRKAASKLTRKLFKKLGRKIDKEQKKSRRKKEREAAKAARQQEKQANKAEQQLKKDVEAKSHKLAEDVDRRALARKAPQHRMEEGEEYNVETYGGLYTHQNIELANKLNDALNIASELQKNFPHGNGKYAAYLEPLMKHLTDYKDDSDNEYFTVYQDRNKNFLYEDVRFHALPYDDPKVRQFVDKILELDWSSYENYADKYQDIRQSIYESNVFGDGDIDEDLKDYEMNMFMELENIMNSSASWHIASLPGLESDQVKARWSQLYNIGKDAVQFGVKDLFRRMVRNEDTLENIETEIYAAIKRS